MAYRSVNSIIHSASCLAAATAAGLAQVPGSDAPVLAAIQADMIRDIAAYYNEEITTVRALSLVATFSATAVGRFVSQWLVGWIPGLGNAINASTAAAITERVSGGLPTPTSRENPVAPAATNAGATDRNTAARF